MARSGLLSFALLAFTVVTYAQERELFPNGSDALYSQEATTLDPGHVRLVSPDGKKTLVVRRVQDSHDPDGMHINYTVTISNKTFKAKLLGFNGEVAWSPDSKAFVVTQTEGGGGLGSRVYVFYVDKDGIRKLDVSGPIEKDFGYPVRCDVKVPPNTGFIAWQTDSSTLLVAAEVVPVSICDCSGTYRVYQMKLPTLTIARTYSQTEAKRQFGKLLGSELRDADDSCVKILERNGHHTAQRSKTTSPPP